MFQGNLNKICGSDVDVGKMFRKIWEILSKF